MKRREQHHSVCCLSLSLCICVFVCKMILLYTIGTSDKRIMQSGYAHKSICIYGDSYSMANNNCCYTQNVFNVQLSASEFALLGVHIYNFQIGFSTQSVDVVSICPVCVGALMQCAKCHQINGIFSDVIGSQLSAKFSVNYIWAHLFYFIFVFFLLSSWIVMLKNRH